MKIFITVHSGCVTAVYSDYVGKVEVEIIDQDSQEEVGHDEALKREDEIAAEFVSVL